MGSDYEVTYYVKTQDNVYDHLLGVYIWIAYELKTYI